MTELLLVYIGIARVGFMTVTQDTKPVGITNIRLIQIRDAYKHLAQKGERSHAPQTVINSSYEMVALMDELLELRSLYIQETEQLLLKLFALPVGRKTEGGIG